MRMETFKEYDTMEEQKADFPLVQAANPDKWLGCAWGKNPDGSVNLKKFRITEIIIDQD